MSIASEITRINGNIASAYTACNNKGATMPATQNSANLATTIGSISTGGRDWSQIGYSAEPDVIDDGFEYAEDIYDEWDDEETDYSYRFYNDVDLIFMPNVDTSVGTDFCAMFSGCTKLINMPLLDTSNGTDFSEMFRACTALKTIPALDTSSGTEFYCMFDECYSLETVPLLDTSNGTDFSEMFSECYFLETIPSLDTSNGTDFSYMCEKCYSLASFPLLDVSNGTSLSGMCANCSHLRTVPLLDFSSATNVYDTFINCFILTTMAGLDDLGKAYTTSMPANNYQYELDLHNSIQLTEQSLINILTNLYDIATKGCNAQKCTLGATNIAKLTSSAGQAALSSAQSKGWTVS